MFGVLVIINMATFINIIKFTAILNHVYACQQGEQETLFLELHSFRKIPTSVGNNLSEMPLFVYITKSHHFLPVVLELVSSIQSKAFPCR